MQCPLCRETVADDNALQVHYLMSCRGYLDGSSTSKQSEAPPSKKLVQFRWIKSKPTLAREVYLISSLAGSVKLDWRTLDECFLSDQVEVPQGLHVCQLVVDGDAISTHDFTVSDTSRTIDVLISQVPQDTTGNISEEENPDPATQPVSGPEPRDEQDGRSEVTAQQLPEKGSLYRELLNHQILHGDSLETLTGGESGGGSHERKRTRGNGVATRTSRDQRSSEDNDRRTVGDHTTRSRYKVSDQPSQRQMNDVVQDSLSSDELQQFLQPARTRQENDDDVGEERVSSLSDNEEHSVSLSSHDGYEGRPELLGQSNGESESRVQPDAGSPTRMEADHRQETRLIDLGEPASERSRETSSKARDRSSDDRDRPSNDQEGTSGDGSRLLLDQRESSGNLREESAVDDRRRPSDESRERPSTGRDEPSSSVRREQTLADGREGDYHEPTGNRETSESRREDSTTNRKPSEGHRDLSRNSSEASNGDREQPRTVGTEASSDDREETSSAVESRQERTGLRERTSDNDRRKPTYHRGILESQNGSNRDERTLFLNESGFQSLPASFPSGQRNTVESSVLSGDLISLTESDILPTHGMDRQTRGRISPRSSTTTVTSGRDLDSGIIFTGGRGLPNTTNTDDLLFRKYSASRTNAVLAKHTNGQSKDTNGQSKDANGQSKDSRTHKSHRTSVQSRNILESRDDLESRDISPSSDTPQNTDVPQTTHVTAPSRDVSTLSGDTPQRGDTSQNRDPPENRDPPHSRDTPHNEQTTSNVSGDDNSAATTRRSPQGSFTERDIRRPPLYTSAPSRPYSSLPFTSHTAISPLSSPRHEVSNETRATSSSTRGRVDRVAPAGSTVEPERMNPVPSTSRQFSEDRVKELLESLKKESAAPRERPGTSEMTSLKSKLAERDETVKTLKEKNVRYKTMIEELRGKVVELTKDLSLAEANKNKLRDQEEISSELENALGDKELECAQLKNHVFVREREQREQATLFEQAKKEYEKKIHDLRKIRNSLDQEVKTLRERSSLRTTSPKSSKEYKKMVEQFQESLAVSASLEDQVKTLQKENKDLKEQLKMFSPRSRQENVASHNRDLHRSELGSGREDYSSVNGHPETRHQTDTLRRLTDYDRDNGSQQAVIENSRYTSGGASRTSRFRQQPDITRGRSDVFGSESPETSPRSERSRSRESRSRQRYTTADDVQAGISGLDYRVPIPKRSHSSDSIRNVFPDGSRSKVSPSQERESHEMDRRYESLHHSGSFDNLYTRPTSSSPIRDVALTGHHVDLTPTSPDQTSPRSKRRSSPGKSSPFAPDAPQQLDIGMKVLISRHRGKLSRGVVKYIGYLPDKKEQVYVGVELLDADGKHDGKFNGRRFFKCQPNHGIFVPFEKIVMAYA